MSFNLLRLITHSAKMVDDFDDSLGNPIRRYLPAVIELEGKKYLESIRLRSIVGSSNSTDSTSACYSANSISLIREEVCFDHSWPATLPGKPDRLNIAWARQSQVRDQVMATSLIDSLMGLARSLRSLIPC
jgi:hypothetical protein